MLLMPHYYDKCAPTTSSEPGPQLTVSVCDSFLSLSTPREVWLLVVFLFCCCCSVTKSYLALCDPMVCSTPGLPVHHQLPEFTETHIHRVSDAIQPSHQNTSLCLTCTRKLLQIFPSSTSTSPKPTQNSIHPQARFGLFSSLTNDF